MSVIPQVPVSRAYRTGMSGLWYPTRFAQLAASAHHRCPTVQCVTDFSLPYIALLLYAEMGRTRYPKLYIAIHRPIYIRCYLIVVILWWIGRNLTTNF